MQQLSRAALCYLGGDLLFQLQNDWETKSEISCCILLIPAEFDETAAANAEG